MDMVPSESILLGWLFWVLGEWELVWALSFKGMELGPGP